MPQFKAGAKQAGEHLKSHKAIHDGESSSLFLSSLITSFVAAAELTARIGQI